MGWSVYSAVGMAPREAAARYCVGSEHDTGGRAQGAGLLQVVPEGQGVRQLLHTALLHLSKVAWVRMRCQLSGQGYDLRPRNLAGCRAMVKRYGDDAAREAEFRADELLVEGDAEGYAIWRRIMEAVEGLSETEPGGRVN